MFARIWSIVDTVKTYKKLFLESKSQLQAKLPYEKIHTQQTCVIRF